MTNGRPQRCPACRRLNRIPLHASGQARCGACGAPLSRPRAEYPPPGSGDLRALVIQRWDALVRFVPRGMALGAVIGSPEAEAGSDPVSWLAQATSVPRNDLDQVRLLRVHLASNQQFAPQVLTRALEILDRAHRALEGTRLPD